MAGTAKRSRTTRKVTATCAECGQTREVRPSLIRGFDALVCASHRGAGRPASLAVPDGHHIVTEHNVAGYFTGYRVVETTPADARAIARARALIAAASPDLPPEPWQPPAAESAWTPLVNALEEELGPDGWEIAEAVRERDGGRRVWVAKIYTGFGWAGIAQGTPREIARFLADARKDYTRQIENAGLACPSCGVDLSPAAGRTQCACGTVAWNPRGYSASDRVSVVAGVLAYLDGAPAFERAREHILLTQLLLPRHEWAQEQPVRLPDGFDHVVEALRVLVPAARWAMIADWPHGVVPVGARWEAGDAERLREAVAAVGYRLAVEQDPDDWRAHVLRLVAEPETGSRRPRWIDIVTDSGGGRAIRVDAEGDELWEHCRRQYSVPEDEEDDELYDVACDVLFARPPTAVGETWTVNGLLAEDDLTVEGPLTDALDPENLRSALRDGRRAVEALHTAFLARIGEVLAARRAGSANRP